MRCLVVADFNDSLVALREVLERLEVEVVEVDRLGVDWLTENPTPPIDFVCAVLRASDRRAQQDAVFVDIGVALGRGTPVLLVVETGRATPLVLAGLTRLEANLDNVEALELHITQFLRSLLRAAPSRPSADQERRLSEEQARNAHYQLDLLSAAGVPRLNAHEFEQLMYGLLADEVGALTSRPFSHDGGWDVAVWPRTEGSIFGSPIVVQLKLWSAGPGNSLTYTIEAFDQQVSKQGALFGLLIFHSMALRSESRAPFESSRSGRVVAISAHSFIDALSDGTLSRLLIDVRNSIVHGVRGFV